MTVKTLDSCKSRIPYDLASLVTNTRINFGGNLYLNSSVRKIFGQAKRQVAEDFWGDNAPKVEDVKSWNFVIILHHVDGAGNEAVNETMDRRADMSFLSRRCNIHPVCNGVPPSIGNNFLGKIFVTLLQEGFKILRQYDILIINAYPPSKFRYAALSQLPSK